MKNSKQKLLRFLQSLKNEWKRLTDEDYFTNVQQQNYISQVVSDLMEQPVELRFKLLGRITQSLKEKSAMQVNNEISSTEHRIKECNSNLTILTENLKYIQTYGN